jgi:hypothetical protein
MWQPYLNIAGLSLAMVLYFLTLVSHKPSIETTRRH